jgi:hypothetical protein
MSHRAFDGYTAPQTVNGVDGYGTTIRAQRATGTNSRGGDLTLGSGKGTARDGYVVVQVGDKNVITAGSTGVTVDGYIGLGSNLNIGGNLRVDGYSSVGSYSTVGSYLTVDGYQIVRSSSRVDGYLSVGSYALIDGYIKMDGYLTLDGYEIKFDGYDFAPAIKQLDMPIPGLDGYHMTIKAQSSTVDPARGGNLILRSGDGYVSGDGYYRDGYINFFSGPNEVVRVVPNKLFTLSGQRINLADIASTPFVVPDGYHTMLIDTSAVAVTIILPLIPVRGDIYQVKDRTGNAGTNTITVSGNGINIDGVGSYSITTNYGKVTLVFNGTTWSVL